MTWRDVVAKTKGTHRTVWGSTRFDVLGTVLKVGNAFFLLSLIFVFGGEVLDWVGWRPLLFFSWPVCVGNGRCFGKQDLCVDDVQGLSLST